jgi:TonB-dependent SusC/RagA subfamily outer membrane receptor
MKILLLATILIFTIGKPCHSQAKSNSRDSIVFKGTTCYTFKRIGNPLVLLNGKKVSKAKLKRLRAENVDSIRILKDASAILPYGKRGQYGVILIKTR